MMHVSLTENVAVFFACAACLVCGSDSLARAVHQDEVAADAAAIAPDEWMTDEIFVYRGDLFWRGEPVTGVYDLEFRLLTTADGVVPIGLPIVASDWSVNRGLVEVGLVFEFVTSDMLIEGAWLEVSVNGSILSPRRYIPPQGWGLRTASVATDGIPAMTVNPKIDAETTASEATHNPKDDEPASVNSESDATESATRNGATDGPPHRERSTDGSSISPRDASDEDGDRNDGEQSGRSDELISPGSGWTIGTGTIFTIDRVGVGPNTPGHGVHFDVHSGRTMAFKVTNINPNRHSVYSVGGLNFFDGFVGLGVPFPSARLHVGGTAGVDGVMFPDGTLQTTAFEPYSAAEELVLLGTTFRLAQQKATDGYVLKWHDGQSAWRPALDNDTTYSARGPELELNGTQFGLAAQGASDGQVLKWSGGAWRPGTDNEGGSGGGGDITEVRAGEGLDGGGSFGSVELEVEIDGIRGFHVRDGDLSGNDLASDPFALSRVSGGAMFSEQGRIGIGTPSPSTPLHVVGTGTFTGDVHAISGVGAFARVNINGSGNERLYVAGDARTVGTQHCDADLNVRGAFVKRNSSGNTRALISTTSEGSGGIDVRGSVGLNVNISHLASFPNNGFVSLRGNNTQQAGIYVNEDGEGIVFADEKNFRISNPRDPSTDIWYACVEGPEAAAYIRGTGVLVNGRATIELPTHFQDVAILEGMTVQLTPRSFEAKGLATGQRTLVNIEVGELMGGTGNYEFDWEVKCVRRGHEDFDVIRPKSYGQPVTIEEDSVRAH